MSGHTLVASPFPTPSGWKAKCACGHLARGRDRFAASEAFQAHRGETARRGECVASGCTADVLTSWNDGVSDLELCERHGDLLAVGFPLKQGARDL